MIGRAIFCIVRGHMLASKPGRPPEQCERWQPRGARGGEGRAETGGSIRTRGSTVQAGGLRYNRYRFHE
jgi:hypothetical protein